MALTGQGSIQEEVAVKITGDGASLMDTLDAAETGLLNLKNIVGGVSAALAGAGVAGFAAATAAAADYEEALVEVEKVTNPETAREMGQAIKEMAAEMPIAQQELAAITADAGRFGIEGSENIRMFTESVARMAVATDLSSQEAGESLARLATLTKTPIDEIENLGSAINELSNNTATSSSEIVESMLRASGQLSQIGLSSDEMVALSASLNEVSESADRAGTRLRSLGQDLVDPRRIGDIAAALGMTSEAFNRMRDETPLKLIRRMVDVMGQGDQEARQLAATLSGEAQQALTGLARNSEGLNRALQMSNSSYREATSLQKEYEAASQTFNAELQRTRNRLFNVAQTTGSSLLPALTGLLEDLNAGISAFQDWNEATDGAAGSAAAASATIVGLGGTATWFAGGPVGVFVGAVAAIATAYATNFADIRETVNRTMADVSAIIGRTLEDDTAKTQEELGKQVGLWRQFETVLGSILDEAGVGFVNLIDYTVTLTDVLGKLSAAARDVASGNFEEAGQRIENIRGFAGRLMDRRSERVSALRDRQDRRRAILRGESVPDVIGGSDAEGARTWTGSGGSGASADAAAAAQEAAEASARTADAYRQAVNSSGGGATGGTFTPSADLLGISQARYMQLSQGGAITRQIPQTQADLEKWAKRKSGALKPSDVGLTADQFRRLNKGIPLRYQPGSGSGGSMATSPGAGVSATQKFAQRVPDAALKFESSVNTFAKAVEQFATAEITVDQQGFVRFVENQIASNRQQNTKRYQNRTNSFTGGI